MGEQSLLQATHHLSYIPIECHDDITNDYRVMGSTRSKNTQISNNKTMKGHNWGSNL